MDMASRKSQAMTIYEDLMVVAVNKCAWQLDVLFPMQVLISGPVQITVVLVMTSLLCSSCHVANLRQCHSVA